MSQIGLWQTRLTRGPSRPGTSQSRERSKSMSRKALMGFLMVLLLATLAFAQSDTQVSPSKPDKSQDSIKKSDKHDHSMSDAKSNTSTQSAPASALSSDDRKFITEVAHGGMMEVQLSRTAVDKATNPDVKQFAQRMIDDHSKANAELSQLASQKGITLPATADAAVSEPSS